MSDVHVVLDMLRMYFLVKIYKTAFGLDFKNKMPIFCLLLIEAKYKFVGITHQFNDCFMMMFCLFSMRAW